MRARWSGCGLFFRNTMENTVVSMCCELMTTKSKPFPICTGPKNYPTVSLHRVCVAECALQSVCCRVCVAESVLQSAFCRVCFVECVLQSVCCRVCVAECVLQRVCCRVCVAESVLQSV